MSNELKKRTLPFLLIALLSGGTNEGVMHLLNTHKLGTLAVVLVGILAFELGVRSVHKDTEEAPWTGAFKWPRNFYGD